MQIQSFQDLHVWEKGHQLVLEIYKLTKHFPKEERFGLAGQIRRSAVSVCANIAEGHRKSTREFLRFLEIAQGSLEETKYHLILSKDLQYCHKNEFEILIELANEIGKMLSILRKRIRFKQ